MIPAARRSKLRLVLHAMVLLVSAGACAPFRRPVPPDSLPKRVVLALDGLDYRDVLAARQRGRFAAFHEPARLVSTFPSISDIAWHAILGVQPPAGYQRVFYSTRHNAVLGDALSAISPIEYEARVDYAFDAKFHHLGAYLISWPVARREVDTDMQYILSSRGRETVYLYNVGPDALQHTRGDVAAYLDYLSLRLDSLLARYRARTGRTLEVLVLSDHGHNRAREAAFVPVVETLAARGFRTASSITGPRDVAFSVDGVTTGFGVFCAAESAEQVAELLSGVEGVAVVSRQRTADRFDVLAGQARGVVERQHAGNGDRYRYLPSAGDPLRLTAVMDSMRTAGVLDADGYADASAWVRYTAAHEYPVAVVRIAHGHTEATRNPAPILVSLDDRYRVGLGMVSVANRMRPLGGTHGALSATNALGVILSNVRVPYDDLAMSVRRQFGGFDDLLTDRRAGPALHVMEAAVLRDDRLSRREWPVRMAAPAVVPDSGPVAVVSLTPQHLRWAGADARLRVEVRERDQSPAGGTLVRTLAVPVESAWKRFDARQLAWSAERLGLTGLAPGREYQVLLQLERVRRTRDGVVIDRAQQVLVAIVRAATDGTAWSY